MALDSTILSDDSRLSRLDRFYHHAESWLSLAGGIVIFLLVILASMNVLGRWLFSMPVSGYIDWVEQAMAGIAFLGIAYTQRLGGHIRMDIFVGALRGRWLWLTEFISTSVMLLITLVLVYGSFLHFLRAYQIGDSSVDIDLPTWPAKLIVPFALSVLALRLMLQLWGFARAFKRNQVRPVAVPLVEDAATIAAREAEALGSDK